MTEIEKASEFFERAVSILKKHAPQYPPNDSSGDRDKYEEDAWHFIYDYEDIIRQALLQQPSGANAGTALDAVQQWFDELPTELNPEQQKAYGVMNKCRQSLTQQDGGPKGEFYNPMLGEIRRWNGKDWMPIPAPSSASTDANDKFGLQTPMAAYHRIVGFVLAQAEHMEISDQILTSLQTIKHGLLQRTPQSLSDEMFDKVPEGVDVILCRINTGQWRCYLNTTMIDRDTPLAALTEAMKEAKDE